MEGAASGNASGFETPELANAEERSHAFDLDTCGWLAADVTTKDFEFDGLPDRVDSGPLSIEMTNTGSEVHEVTVLRVTDGAKRTAEELLVRDAGSGSILRPIGSTGPVEPGGRSSLVVDLRPGRYVVSCLLPVGSTSIAALESAPDHASPYAMMGMTSVIDVNR